MVARAPTSFLPFGNAWRIVVVKSQRVGVEDELSIARPGDHWHFPELLASLLRRARNCPYISRCRSCVDLRAEPSGPSRRKMKNLDKVTGPLLAELRAEMAPQRTQATTATCMVRQSNNGSAPVPSNHAW